MTRGRRRRPTAALGSVVGLVVAGSFATGGTASPTVAYLPTPPTPAPVQPAALPPQVEATRGLTPELQRAWSDAVTVARAAGVTLTLTSGHRTPAEQQRLWVEGVAEHGSEAEARKWVAPPWESAHVRGLALDVGPTPAAMAWLERHQDRFGLCRRFVNEPWHFELRRPEWKACPALRPNVADPLR